MGRIARLGSEIEFDETRDIREGKLDMFAKDKKIGGSPKVARYAPLNLGQLKRTQRRALVEKGKPSLTSKLKCALGFHKFSTIGGARAAGGGKFAKTLRCNYCGQEKIVKW
jgi:hypothetical protein